MTKRETLTIDRQEYSLLYGLYIDMRHGLTLQTKGHLDALDEFYAKEEELRASR